MSEVEVLVTTMNQSDFSKYTQMNLQTDAVIANQVGIDKYSEKNINDHKVKLISTCTRGLSRNRNIAMAYASQNDDFILFADDDLVFNDGYEQLILEEFKRHPKAEAIKFNIHDLSETRKICMRQIEKFEKATRHNMTSSGVCGMVVRRCVLINHNLHFHENFGAGTENYCGEDTIFLMEMLKKKVRIYRSPIDIAGIDQSESSWFCGHDERFFTTAGMVLGEIYPKLSYLLVIRSAFKAYCRRDSGMSFKAILNSYYKGIRNQK